jgi:hypothetical protein
VIYIVEVHMSAGGSGHAHIADVRWRNPSTGATDESSRAQIVTWIEEGGEARVRDGAGDDVRVGIIDVTPPYIRTYADGVWTDNLLSLTRY